jgi:hypothetical protein
MVVAIAASFLPDRYPEPARPKQGPDEIEALDVERVLMIATWWGRFRATGIREEISIAQVVTLADGKMTRIESYHSREEALEAAGIQE